MEHPELLEITRQVLACRKCRDCPETFLGGLSVLRSPWLPPRGWAGLPVPGKTDVVLVALNTGAPFKNEPAEREKIGIYEISTTISPEQALKMNEFALNTYQHPPRGQDSVFHRKSLALAQAILWLLDNKDPGESVWNRCWFTDLFKCSTRRENSPQLTKSAVDACRSYLDAELKACNPKIVVALGNRAFKHLAGSAYNVVKFRHPSNGCPRLDAAYHDNAFGEVAKLLNVSYNKDAFRHTRKAVYECAMNPWSASGWPA